MKRLTSKIRTMKKNIIRTVALSLSIILLTLQITSCKEAEIEIYDEKAAIYFPNNDGNKYGIDTAHVSFFHNPGKDVLSVPFRVVLIGELLKEDTEYSVEIIDSLTTATPDEYALPKKILFRKGAPIDTLHISIFRKERLLQTSVTLALKIIENENFKIGYYNMQRIRLRFDDIVSQPLWWDNVIEYVYMGKFSVRKYNVYIEVSGKVDIDGLESWELRQICLDMKDYIKEHKIVEEDGSPMKIICY